ncbi:hypothetical protein pdam_00004619 [Pocillopora damicornis]|uniref:Uncharacterized protein n=1 Tax=Pocillopora damicornis TaxID=46731 RepID=A0A3M6ULH9_POCDA|nr:hypothetical protein pdam_00004619 [Pocillopora damicornis]
MEKGPTKIVEFLAEGNVKISSWGVIKFLQIFQEMHSLKNSARRPFFDLGSVIGAKGQTHATKACLGAVRNKVPLN